MREHKLQSTPGSLGSLDYHRYLEDFRVQTCVGTLSSAVPNANAGWLYTVDQLGLFFEHTLAIPQEDPRARDLVPPNMWAPADPAPPIVNELLGNYLDSIRNLARRTSQMHTRSQQPFRHYGFRARTVHHVLPPERLSRDARAVESRLRSCCVRVRVSCRRRGRRRVSEVLSHESELRAQLLTLRTSACRARAFAITATIISRTFSHRQRLGDHQLRQVIPPVRSANAASSAPPCAMWRPCSVLSTSLPRCALRRRSGIVPSREAHPQLGSGLAWYRGSARSSSRNIFSAAELRRSCRADR